MPRPRITVLGGGVIGLAAATAIQEAYPAGSVTLAAADFQQHTTSFGAAGLWQPYLGGAQQDPELINRWGAATYSHLERVHASADAAVAGVISATGYLLWTGGENPVPAAEPTWQSVVQHFHRLSDRELQAFAQPYEGGWAYSTLIAEGRRYLPWLTARFQQAGGRLAVRDLSASWALSAALHSSDDDSLACDVLVNCTGLRGARQLFGDDSVYPIRGQVLRVRAPWVKHYHSIDGTFYMIPQTGDEVVLGGTSQLTGENSQPSEADRQRILNNCCAHLPSLRHAEILEEWVGYRPGRPSVRLELVFGQFERGDSLASLPVVHNYGHGGSGITLHWGCAVDTLALVQQALGH